MRTGPLITIVGASAFVLAAGIAVAQPEPPANRSAAMCPAAVPGTKVEVADVKGGVTLTFTTTGDVTELQRRVQAMADHHNQRQQMGGRGHGMGMGPPANMPLATRTVEKLPNGARITVKPDDPSQLEALRVSVREHAKGMQTGTCPMMGDRKPSE